MLYITAVATRWSLLGSPLARQNLPLIINIYPVSTVIGDLCEMDIKLFRFCAVHPVSPAGLFVPVPTSSK